MAEESRGQPKQKVKTTGVVVNVLRVGEPNGSNEENPSLNFHFLSLLRSGGKYKGQWWPVAGTCEADEDPLNTALRELMEETGITPNKLFELNMPVEHIDDHFHLQGYVAFVESGCTVTLNYEHSDYRWISVDEALAAVPDDGSLVIQYVVDNYVLKSPSESWLVWPTS